MSSFIARSESYDMPSFSIVSVGLFSISTSLMATSRSKISRPPGSSRFTVMLFLLRAWELNMGERLNGRLPGTRPGVPPEYSGRLSISAWDRRGAAPRVRGTKALVDSTRITSAPRSARNEPQ